MAQRVHAVTIFAEAIAITSPQERAAYLDRACQEELGLRQEVEKLVADYFRAGEFLEKPVAHISAPTLDPPHTDSPGTQIGPYMLLQVIGEGGMGTIFMAEQTQPVYRKVAIKVIKPGLDSRHVIARFEAERQALAMMDHVNISRVLDFGATESGRPYFVMELVEGVPITEYCDDNRLTLRQRLELFMPVCRAIQHAHQKGIIHCDIKPSNVMVTLDDGKPVPKVIDFGVAKATEQKLAGPTLSTAYDTVVGTLEYMSPEQTETSALGVDTRSDIYSLGVLLYELLTGSTPLGSKRMNEATYAESLRLIKEEEPPKPSTRLTESSELLVVIAAQRQMEPAKLVKLLRGELEWILMKTLAKDPNRRYETANAFATDVQRYLDDEPVQACPPSASYRARKFVRRNKGAVIAASLLVLALLGGIIGTSLALVRVTQARGDAIQAQKAELVQRQRAEASFQQSLGAVDQFFTRLANTRLKDEPHAERLRKELLEDALDFYQRVLQDAAADRHVRFEAGAVTCRVAEIRRKLGQQQPAVVGFQQAIAMFEQLIVENPQDVKAERELARSHKGLARCWDFEGKYADAEAAYRQAAKIQQALAARPDAAWEFHNDLSTTQNDLGAFFLRTQRMPEAENAFQQSLDSLYRFTEAKADDPDYQSAISGRLNNLSIIKAMKGDLAEASELLEQALKFQRAALIIDPANLEYRTFYRNQLENLAMNRGRLGDRDQGITALREVVQVGEELAADFPFTPEYQFELAATYHNLALALQGAGQTDAARQEYGRSHQLYAQLVARYPEAIEYQLQLGQSQSDFARWLWSENELTEAEQAYRISMSVLETLAQRTSDPSHWREFAQVCLDLGLLLKVAQHESEANEVFRSALLPAERAAVEAPSIRGHWQTASHAYYRNGQWQDAITSHEKAVQQGTGGGASLFLRAMAHQQLGDPDQARRWYKDGIEWMKQHAPVAPPVLRVQTEAAELLGINETSTSEVEPSSKSDGS